MENGHCLSTPSPPPHGHWPFCMMKVGMDVVPKSEQFVFQFACRQQDLNYRITVNAINYAIADQMANQY